MNKYVRVYEKHMAPQYCKEIIAMYKALPEHHYRYDHNGSPNMDQMNFTQHRDVHPILHQYLVNLSLQAIQQYKIDVPEAIHWPEKYSLEDFRIKHYSAGGVDRFDEHVDVKSLISAKRFLIFFWYLNDVEEGGETEVTNIGVKVKAEKGKLLTLPPYWMFPHIGHPVSKGEKYLLSSYMHLNEDSK